jgi:hypothetical protein
MGRSADLYRKLCASIAPTVFSHMEVSCIQYLFVLRCVLICLYVLVLLLRRV